MTMIYHLTLESLIELPHPATKLIVGQYFWIHPSRRSWAWLVVGSFYDSEARELWHIEIFIGYRDNATTEFAESLTSDASNATDEGDEYFRDNIEAQLNLNNFPNEYNGTELQGEVLDNFFTHIVHYSGDYTDYTPAFTPIMAAQTFGNGWHPQFGPDQTANANANPSFGNVVPGVVYTGSSGYSYLPNQGISGLPGGVVPGPNNQAPVYVIPQNGYNHPVPVFPSQGPRLPNPHPVVNLDAPALNLNNSTGGVGCEPGYNYFFPPEHTKLHVVKSSTAPWRLPEGMSMNFGAYHVPVNTTLAELLVGFGALNPCPKKNKVTEVIQGGNGKWYRGVTFSGDSESMTKTLRDLGWDRSRTGRTGEKPVIWLWITKD
ncbi:uncharacterized protein F4817DRAFT_358578 [Daldinia loculata]|uniref:uncharacterized protein n=1 Tax=Daldinia loculata TaxID=103429 RepID=UPI0020C1C727|nr:uncharacterized protein F4817DRAFT_358578 [Daldinia loculata]KAI1647489.1 hypothetical protein F4817DRAFT_358578 [Daldinia loculata]